MSAALVALALTAGPAGADPSVRPLELRQGTDLSVTVAPGGEHIIGLAGRLWRLPSDGGTALPITPAGEFARRPVFSPDGSMLAWEALHDGHFQLVVARADGSEPQPLTSGPWHHLAPAWSPDGQRLALASNRGGDFSIWLLQRDSGALIQLSFDRGNELDPAWDPVGDGLAYISEDAGRSSLVLRTPTQPHRVLANSSQRLRAPAWRPDGNVISYVSLGPQGGRLNMVILSAPPVTKPLVRGENAFNSRVAWLDRSRFLYAADGQLRQRDFGKLDGAAELPFRATFELRAAPEPAARRLPDAPENQPVRGLAGMAPLPNGNLVVAALGDLWELDAAGNLVRAITQDAFVDRDPATSRDGRWLAYASDRSGSPQIWLRDLVTGTARELTAEPGGASHPALDTSASRIAYLAGEPGSSQQHLKLLTVAGGTSQQIAAGLIAPGTPAWSTDDSQVALVQDDGGIRRLLLFTPTPGAGLRRVVLPAPVAARGQGEVAWSPDGKSLAIAAAAGIRVLPVLDNGLAGADWQAGHEGPVQLVRWAANGRDLLFIDAQGLGSIATGSTMQRIPISLSWRPAQGSGRTVIRAGRLFDGSSDTYRYDQQLVIDGNRIVAVEPWPGTAQEGATIIDARNKTVMPGLIDLGLRLDDSAGERLGRTLLAFGVTTAQVLAAADTPLREVSERWQAHAAGPRLLNSPEWCPNGQPASIAAGDASGALRLCPALAVQPDAVAPLLPPGQPLWSSHWLAAGSGLVTTISPLQPGGRRPADETFPAALTPYQDAMDVMLQSGITLVPGLATRGLPVLMDDQPGLLGAPQFMALLSPEERRATAENGRLIMTREGPQQRAWLRDRQRLLSRFAAGGGRLAAASGAPSVPYGLGLHAELRLMAGAGLPTATVLRAATENAARSLGLQEEIGHLAPGRRADLLVIDGDPLASLEQLLRIEVVMIDGIARPMSALVPESTASSALEKFTPASQPVTPKRGKNRR